jgi:hypothetical protein
MKWYKVAINGQGVLDRRRFKTDEEYQEAVRQSNERHKQMQERYNALTEEEKEQIRRENEYDRTSEHAD